MPWYRGQEGTLSKESWSRGRRAAHRKANAGVLFGLCGYRSAAGDKKSKQKVESILRLDFDANLHAVEFRRHVTEADDCKRLPNASKDDELPEKGFTMQNMKSERRSSVF